MVKILTKRYERYLAGLADRIGHRIDYLKGYLEISQTQMTVSVANALERKKTKLQKGLLPLELRAMSKETYATFISKEAIDHLEASRQLKKRALTQTYRRKLKKHPDQKENIIRDLDLQKQIIDTHFNTRLQTILTKAEARHQGDGSTRNQEELHTKKATINALLAETGKTLDEQYSLRLKTLEENVNQKVKRLQDRLIRVEHRLERIHTEISAPSITMDPAEILRVQNLTMTFGGLKAVNDLSFSVKKGEVFGLIGPNGAGKTTVFNCITQFYKPKDGLMLYRNNKGNVISLGDYKVHDVIKEGITRTFQNVELIFELSVLDNMLVGAHTMFKTGFLSHILHTRRMKREETIMHAKALHILKSLGLDLFKDAYPMGLPYGILKRIELARTLMAKPSLIILDEPAAGLNDAETLELGHTIKMIRDTYDTTIFLVEHDMPLVMDVCDTICAINFGKRLAIGSPETIKNNKDVQEAYLGGE